MVFSPHEQRKFGVVNTFLVKRKNHIPYICKANGCTYKTLFFHDQMKFDFLNYFLLKSHKMIHTYFACRPHKLDPITEYWNGTFSPFFTKAKSNYRGSAENPAHQNFFIHFFIDNSNVNFILYNLSCPKLKSGQLKVYKLMFALELSMKK